MSLLENDPPFCFYSLPSASSPSLFCVYDCELYTPRQHRNILKSKSVEIKLSTYLKPREDAMHRDRPPAGFTHIFAADTGAASVTRLPRLSDLFVIYYILFDRLRHTRGAPRTTRYCGCEASFSTFKSVMMRPEISMNRNDWPYVFWISST